jgi:cation diffusion facilitator CzcD-associated flavoprotein CzcO
MGNDRVPKRSGVKVTPFRGAYDVIVIGAGLGGLYAVYRLRHQGLSVLGLEAAGGVGGVWYHNRYPGARVDLDSLDYCYYFSEELARSWRWTERYASQPELLAYLNFVADRYALAQHFRFRTRMTGGRWDADAHRWEVTTSADERFHSRFLLMATGNLSHARRPPFVGLDRFTGDWVLTSHWPEREVPLDGRRIGVFGTGSTGVQVIPALAERASHLTVFQRTANYVVPAVNHPLREEPQRWLAEHLSQERAKLLRSVNGTRSPRGTRPAADFSDAEREELLERQWAFGGQGMNRVFSDQGTDIKVNHIVAEFVRAKVRKKLESAALAEKLSPRAYPIGTRRLALDTGYYETFNRDNVQLVDLRDDPVIEVTESGVRTAGSHHEFDLLVFALGFHAFTGAIDAANIRNGLGRGPTDSWGRGPRTALGLMTPSFPNLFFPTGAGSPSVLANLFLNNECCIDWIADAIAYLDRHGYATIEATEEAADRWQAHVAEVAAPLLRLRVDNYMVHVNADGTRVFMPYVGGLGRFAERAQAIAAAGYEGFALRATPMRRSSRSRMGAVEPR